MVMAYRQLIPLRLGEEQATPPTRRSKAGPASPSPVYQLDLTKGSYRFWMTCTNHPDTADSATASDHLGEPIPAALRSGASLTTLPPSDDHDSGDSTKSYASFGKYWLFNKAIFKHFLEQGKVRLVMDKSISTIYRAPLV